MLPTIADMLGVRIPWPIDGRSALRPTDPARRRRMIISKKFRHTYLVDTPAYQSARRAALARKLRLFGAGLYAFGPRPDLLGRTVPVGGSVEQVDRGSGYLPVHVAGSVPDGRRGGGRQLAVAVNGRIVATGLTFTLEDADDEQYSVIVPERSLRDGRNRIEVLLVEGERLTPLR